MDMTQVDFGRWDSKYLARPVIVNEGEALDVLENLKDEKRKIFVHIEECNMIHHDRSQFERGIDNILRNNKNIILVYSTSAMNFSYLTDWIEKFVDLRVVFQIGMQTFRILRKAKISCLAVEAGRTILLEREKLIAEADRLNIAFTGFDVARLAGESAEQRDNENNR